MNLENAKTYFSYKTTEHTVGWRVVLMVWGVMLLWQLDYLVDLVQSVFPW